MVLANGDKIVVAEQNVDEVFAGALMRIARCGPHTFSGCRERISFLLLHQCRVFGEERFARRDF